MLQEVRIVAVRVVCSCMGTPRLPPIERANKQNFSSSEHRVCFHYVDKVGIVFLGFVLDVLPCFSFQISYLLKCASQLLLISKDICLFIHHICQLLSNFIGIHSTSSTEQAIVYSLFLFKHLLSIDGINLFSSCISCRKLSGYLTPHYAFGRRVGTKPVRPVRAVACNFASCPEPGHFSCPIDVSMNASHHIVADGSNFDRIANDVSARELDPNFADPCKCFLYALGPKVRKVEFKTINTGFMLESTSLLNLSYHRPRYNVSWSKFELPWSIFLHKALAFVVNKIASLAPCTFCYQNAGWQYAGRMKLHKFHVL